MAEAQIS